MLVRWYIIHTKTDNDSKLFRHRNSTKTGLQLLGGVLLESVPCEAQKKDQPDQGAPVGPAAGHAAEDPGRRCSRVQHRPLVDSHWQAQGVSPCNLSIHFRSSLPCILPHASGRRWDHLERDGKTVEMAGEEAFNRALRTWARWVDRNIDPTRTRVFFRSVSPEHKRYNTHFQQQ